jgi:hypothetical protein
MSFLLLLLLVFFGSTRVWTQWYSAFYRQALYHLSQVSSPSWVFLNTLQMLIKPYSIFVYY